MILSVLQFLFTLSLVIFMIGNLSAMGLQLRLADACKPLKEVRFVVVTLLAGFLIGPVLAYLVIRVIPMDPRYATGVLLLSLAPSAPFLPLVAEKARGDLAATAGLMLLASVGTILIMPVAIPFVAPDLSATPWSIAKPMLSLVLLPLAVGILIKSRWPSLAGQIYRYVKSITSVGTILFLLLVLVLNFKAFIGSVGSHALLAQLLYVPALALAGYVASAGMPLSRRTVMSLGICTRNIGAAAAIVGSKGDQRIMVMLVMATIVTIAVSFAEAGWFARTARRLVQHQTETHA